MFDENLIINKEYSTIAYMLKSSDLKRICNHIMYFDKSILMDDLISELYVIFLERNFDGLDEENIKIILKDMLSNKRKLKKMLPLDDYLEQIEEDENQTYNMDNMLEDKELLEQCNKLNLTEEEILVLLYIRDKSNIKKYDYDFIRRKNSKSIDKNKLSIYQTNIILKITNYFSISNK